MAKKATGKSSKAKKGATSKALVKSRGTSGGGRSSDAGMSDAFVKLLQSPLVAELVAVAATAALATLAEHSFTSGDSATRGKRAGKAVKEAGKAAAAAVGRRLGTEIEEIKKASKNAAKA